MIEIKRINIKDALYQQERELRNKVLLRPISIPDYGWEKHDSKSWHFVAIENEKVIGCAVLVPLDKPLKKVQLIQMAIEPEWQGKGLGRLLVSEIIQFAKKNRISEILIHSRSDVTGFYSRLGFQIFGVEFEEVGIKHRYMRINI